MQDRPYMLIGGLLLAFVVAIALAYFVRTRDTGNPISSSTASKTLHAKKGTQREGARALVRTKNLPAPSKGGHADPNDIEIWGSLEPGGRQSEPLPADQEFPTLEEFRASEPVTQVSYQNSTVARSADALPSFPRDDGVSTEPARRMDETYLHAKRLFQEGKYSEAQQLLEAPDEHTDDTRLSYSEAENRVLLALTHSKQGREEEGIKLLRDIMQRTESTKGLGDDRLVHAYRQAALHLTRLLRAQGRRDEADSVKLDPAVVRSSSERGGSLSR